MIGSTILHYRIVEKLGAGGMGVVYKARDLHLDRFVAIKVLPPEKVSDPERRRRFVQEARAASALNHPNIITVHDIASAAGTDFMVIEFVEGKALDQLISRKGMRVSDALGSAAQIADGLAKAHAAGIVHRDLKPSNIMVSNDGVVKILDFGLAKLTETLAADEFTSTRAVSGAEETRTEAGTIVGTVAYMSPEQAEGRKVDARSDIFSFGSVLYEMLTGRQAFRRDSMLSTLAAIKSEDPLPAGDISTALPPQVEEVLARCLRKDPQRRWQGASDLKVVLQDLKEESDSGKLRTSASIPLPARKRARILLIAAACVLLALVAGAVWLLVYRQEPAVGIEITRLTFDSGITTAPTISPDGRLVAYASDRGGKGNSDIWVQQILAGKPVQLTNNPANDETPSFSPDGAQIVFRSQRDGGGLYVVDTLGGEIQGGEARRVADGGYIPRFSPDGNYILYFARVAAPGGSRGRMFLVSPRGGAARPFQPEFSVGGVSAGSAPTWSPDGKYILFCGRQDRNGDTLDWWVAPVEGGPAIRTDARRTLSLSLLPAWDFPCAWSGEFIYYVTGTTVEGINILRARISPGSFQVARNPEQITTGTGMQFWPGVARDGRMVFSSVNFAMNIWSLDAATDQGTASGDPQPLIRDQTGKWGPFISRDGSRLAYVSFSGVHTSQREIRIKNMDSSREVNIPAREGPVFGPFGNPVLSADGSLLAYTDRASQGYASYLIGGNAGPGSGREICAGCTVRDFFLDGKSALVEYAPNRIVRQNLTTGERTVLLETGVYGLRSASLAYDDRWLALTADRPDRKTAVYAVPVRDLQVPEKDWVLLCEGVYYLGSARWSPNGRLLYYLSDRDGTCGIWALRFDPAAGKPLGAEFAVFRPTSARQNMNVPVGNAALGVAPGRLIFYLAEGSGNIYMATPKRR